MLPISVIEEVYRAARSPVTHLHDLTDELSYWYQAFPSCNYLQPCVIEGRAALICQRRLRQDSVVAYQALAAICSQYEVFLKEDARQPGDGLPVTLNRRSAEVILTFCLTFSPCAFAAKAVVPLVASTASSQQMVSMSIQNRSLSEVAIAISSRSGIQFRLNGAVEGDRLHGTLQASNWHDAIAQLLEAYNYSTIQESGHLTTVLVSGYKKGVNPNTFVDENQQQQANSVFIPIDELVSMPEGGCSFVDLPMGVFDVKQETMVAYEDGTLSWVGIMENQNKFYRLYLARNQDGEVSGNVFAPDGTYFIQTIEGQTMIVRADEQSSLSTD